MACDCFDCDCTEYLEISGVPLAGPAWMIEDLTGLLDFPAIRGSNRLVPHLPGRVGHPRRVDETRIVLPFLINGCCDQSGTPFADHRIGFQTNLAYLWTNVFDPSDPDDVVTGTRQAIWHQADGGTATADVHVGSPLQLGLLFSTGNSKVLTATLELTVDAGVFA